MFMKMTRSHAPAVVLGLLFASALSAQLNSAQQSITITATMAESIGITITTGGPINFPLPTALGQATHGSAIPGWTTNWVLSSSRTSVKVYAYFIGATALTGLTPSNTIASTSFSGAANLGVETTFSAAAVTPVNPGGVGLLVSATSISTGNATGSKSDVLSLFLSTGTVPAVDTYTGTLLIQAQATP